MPASKELSNYSDIRAILDAAVAAGGARFTVASPGKATWWRQRANMFRVLFRREAQKGNLVPGLVLSTPYDHWEWVIDEHDKCLILIRPMTAQGTLTDMTGNALQLAQKSPRGRDVREDELLSVADDLVKKLSL